MATYYSPALAGNVPRTLGADSVSGSKIAVYEFDSTVTYANNDSIQLIKLPPYAILTEFLIGAPVALAATSVAVNVGYTGSASFFDAAYTLSTSTANPVWALSDSDNFLIPSENERVLQIVFSTITGAFDNTGTALWAYAAWVQGRPDQIVVS